MAAITILSFTANAGIGMTAGEVKTHYGYDIQPNEAVITLGNINLYFDHDNDVVYAKRVKTSRAKATEMLEILIANNERSGELGWFKYQGDEILVAVQLDLANMKDYYIYFRLAQSDKEIIAPWQL